jgi:hypothetical protein
VSNKIKNTFYNKKTFWIVSKWLKDRPIFFFWKNRFKGHYKISNAKSSFRLLLPTIPDFLKTVVYSIVIIFIFQSYGYYFPIPDTLAKAIDENANDLLTTIASITGVFLGLYFTAISSIASNFLISATQDIRRFFLSTPRGKQYVQTVALTAIISVFYLVAKVFGYGVHPTGIIFLALLSTYIIIRFWGIGSEVFNSLEPTSSFPWVTRDLASYIKGVAPCGFRWKKPIIQNHYRKLASYDLNLLGHLIEFGIRKIELSEEQLLSALGSLGGLLYFYTPQKPKIPSNSFWFKDKVQFEAWGLADSMKISLAMRTGTSLSPETIKDFSWFEEQTLAISMEVFNHFLKKENLGAVLQGHEIFVSVAKNYGKTFDVQSLKILFTELEKLTNRVYSFKIEDAENASYKNFLAFADSQGRLAIEAVLGLSKYLEDNSVDQISKKISKIDWLANNGNIYLTGLPLGLTQKFESISNDLKNEVIIEGRLLSPEWYIQALCFQQYLSSIQAYFKYLKSLHIEYFPKHIEKLLAHGQLGLVVQLIQRWVEFSNKYTNLVARLQKHVEATEQFRKVKDLPWVVFNFEKEEKDALEYEQTATDRMIFLLPQLRTFVSKRKDLPDYFGEALCRGVEACYEACESNNPERLAKIFPVVFEASLEAYTRAKDMVKEWTEEESKIIYATEPLVNLFDLSGYAFLYSELYENAELWNVTKKVWDEYFEKVDPKVVITLFDFIAEYRSRIYKIMPQGLMRSGWAQAFNNEMRQKELAVFPAERSYRDERPNHPSAIIRVIVRWGGAGYPFAGQQVFFAIYLQKYSFATDIYVDGRHDLNKLIEREEREFNEEKQDDE